MRYLLALALALLPVVAKAQTRFLVGSEFSQSYGNTSLGIVAGLELPVAKHFEFDLKDAFSPIESHIALGHGYQNIVRGRGIVWVNALGLTGLISESEYSVTKLAKSGMYLKTGIVYRGTDGDVPYRIYLNYIRELANGIDRRGVETNHLQAGEIEMEFRIGCKGKVCFRTTGEFSVGGVKNQGNPKCDGEWGIPTCPRTYHLSGSGGAGFIVEFPRQWGHEQEAF